MERSFVFKCTKCGNEVTSIFPECGDQKCTLSADVVKELSLLEELKESIGLLPSIVFKMSKQDNGEIRVVFNEGALAYEMEIPTGEVFGKNVVDIYPKELSDVLLPAAQRAFSGNPVNFLTEYQGEVFNVLIRAVKASAIVDTATPMYKEIIGCMTEFTERKLEDRYYVHYINHDQLTGLPNRVLFYDRLRQAILHAEQNQHKIALMMFDLDRFKLINDSLGHAVGDEILKSVANRIVTGVEGKHTVARVGGDGFAIIFEMVKHEEEVRKVAGDIIRILSRPFIVEGHELYVNSSVGISIYPNDGIDINMLMKNADIALHQAKEKGSNTYQKYRYAMNNQHATRLKLENDLRRAIERQEFEVYYQPQTTQCGKGIIGMEALVRWKHPHNGIISPKEFIPVAEETGMIITIGEWVLRQACLQAKIWQVNGYQPIRVSVNLSPKQFQQDNLLEMISGILCTTELEAQYLGLEITESISMHNIDFVIKTLEELNRLGIHVSIDDFGTGYSSLLYLKRFPIQSLKIDRSFIRDITNSTEDAKIALAVIAMAHSLNLKVIAEGVETPEQLEYLMEHRCDNFQGYLFSEPLPAAAFEKLFLHKQQ